MLKTGVLSKRRGTGNSRGFSLMELMITIALIAILIAVALPNYLDYLRKARRADGMEALLQIAAQQEKWRRSDVDYATLAELTAAGYITGATSQEGHYNLAISDGAGGVPTATVFVATATAAGGQAQDTNCPTFTINQDGIVGSADHKRTCWGR